MNWKEENQKGITLIALVVTIVVLLILAGITINMLFSENGIITKAREAAQKTEQAEKDEIEGMQGVANQIDELTSGKNKSDNIKVSYTMTEGSDLWATTVTMNITLEDEEDLTIEQKRNIAAYLCECESMEEVCSLVGSSYEDVLTQLDLTEEEFLDRVIEIGRKYIDYTDTEKLESLGIKIISVLTPYDSTLYTSNLGGELKCSFAKNGVYDFEIKSGEDELTETITIDNLRTAATQAPYNVNIEFISSIPKSFSKKLLYSVDEMNTTQGLSLHYVEKNEEYYKYFNEESPEDWLGIRYYYTVYFAFALIRQQGLTPRQYIIMCLVQDSEAANENEFLRASSRTIEFAEEFPEGLGYKLWGDDIEFSEDMAAKYPDLNLGEDSVISWTCTQYEDGVTESPIYKLEVTHDMNLLLHQEVWD